MKPFRRLLGSLLAPADDPRRGVALPSSTNPDVLLDELRRSRDEVAAIRAHIQARDVESSIAQQLADEELELAEAEEALLLQLDEERARAALIRATEARIRAL